MKKMFMVGISMIAMIFSTVFSVFAAGSEAAVNPVGSGDGRIYLALGIFAAAIIVVVLMLILQKKPKD